MKHLPTARALLIAGIVGTGVAFAGSSQAATLTFFNDASAETDLRFTLSCDDAAGCVDVFPLVDTDAPGVLDDNIYGTYDTTVDGDDTLDGQMFTGVSGAQAEADFVNQNLFFPDVFNFTKEDVEAGKIDMGGAASTSFFSDQAYVLLTIGKDPRLALITNRTGELIKFIYEQTSGTGSGLSHIVGLGEGTTVIPIPATLPLFLTGLLGMGFLARRRRQMAEA